MSEAVCRRVFEPAHVRIALGSGKCEERDTCQTNTWKGNVLVSTVSTVPMVEQSLLVEQARVAWTGYMNVRFAAHTQYLASRLDMGVESGWCECAVLVSVW